MNMATMGTGDQGPVDLLSCRSLGQGSVRPVIARILHKAWLPPGNAIEQSRTAEKFTELTIIKNEKTVYFSWNYKAIQKNLSIKLPHVMNCV